MNIDNAESIATEEEIVRKIVIARYDKDGTLINHKQTITYNSHKEYSNTLDDEVKEINTSHETVHIIDGNGNPLYNKNKEGLEEWYEYDSEGAPIHYRNSEGDEFWKSSEDGISCTGKGTLETGERVYLKYDNNGNEIYTKYLDTGVIHISTYDKNNRCILLVTPKYTIKSKYYRDASVIHRTIIYKDGLDVLDTWYVYDKKIDDFKEITDNKYPIEYYIEKILKKIR